MFFIDYPGALDAIRFVFHHMEKYVHSNDDENPLYYCPPRVVSEGKVRIGCANSDQKERSGKRYTQAQYMKARVRELNPDTGSVEWRHYCPYCLKHATVFAVGVDGRPKHAELEKYTVAAIGVEDLDEILSSVRVLLAHFDPEHVAIPVDCNGMLFEEPMDKLVQQEQEKKACGSANSDKRCVLVTLSDSTGTRLVAEEAVREETAVADKKRE